jgi:hypothetical protein
MTEQRDKNAVEPTGSVEHEAQPVSPTRISRRALMRGASVALPTILTLNSNAAFGWAATSATIATRQAKPNASGDVLCVQGGPPRRGARPGAHPVRTSDFYLVRGDGQYRYYTKDRGGNEVPLNPEQSCTYRGEIYYRSETSDQGTHVRALNGAVASLAHPGAMASLSANGVYPTNWPL